MKDGALVVVATGVLTLSACSNGADAQIACDRWREDFRSAADAYKEAIEAHFARVPYDKAVLEFPGNKFYNEAIARIDAATASYRDRVESVEQRQPEECPRPDTWLDTGDLPVR